MIKEELKQEAEEYALNQWEGNLPWSVIQKSYYDGAEPREKRIAELEAENLQLLKEWRVMDKAKQKAELKVAELMGDVSTLEQDLKRLEAQIEKMKWHDLRKDPNDLPKETGSYVVSRFDNYLKRKKVSQTLFFIKGKGKGKGWQTKMDKTQIIAWCETPQFY